MGAPQLQQRILCHVRNPTVDSEGVTKEGRTYVACVTVAPVLGAMGIGASRSMEDDMVVMMLDRSYSDTMFLNRLLLVVRWEMRLGLSRDQAQRRERGGG